MGKSCACGCGQLLCSEKSTYARGHFRRIHPEVFEKKSISSDVYYNEPLIEEFDIENIYPSLRNNDYKLSVCNKCHWFGKIPSDLKGCPICQMIF